MNFNLKWVYVATWRYYLGMLLSFVYVTLCFSFRIIIFLLFHIMLLDCLHPQDIHINTAGQRASAAPDVYDA